MFFLPPMDAFDGDDSLMRVLWLLKF